MCSGKPHPAKHKTRLSSDDHKVDLKGRSLTLFAKNNLRCLKRIKEPQADKRNPLDHFKDLKKPRRLSPPSKAYVKKGQPKRLQLIGSPAAGSSRALPGRRPSRTALLSQKRNGLRVSPNIAKLCGSGDDAPRLMTAPEGPNVHPARSSATL